jgi:hypothetical protein
MGAPQLGAFPSRGEPSPSSHSDEVMLDERRSSGRGTGRSDERRGSAGAVAARNGEIGAPPSGAESDGSEALDAERLRLERLSARTDVIASCHSCTDAPPGAALKRYCRWSCTVTTSRYFSTWMMDLSSSTMKPARSPPCQRSSPNFAPSSGGTSVACRSCQRPPRVLLTSGPDSPSSALKCSDSVGVSVECRLSRLLLWPMASTRTQSGVVLEGQR